jgi:hypothetical protein
VRESAVWKWIVDHPSPFVAIERVETIHPPGLSDCFFTIISEVSPSANVSGWLELKYCEPNDKAYRAGYIPKLRPTQPMFLTRQFKRRVPCGIFLRVGTECSYLFTPTGEPEWNSEIRSPRALSSLSKKYWTGMPGSTWDVVAQLFPL